MKMMIALLLLMPMFSFALEMENGIGLTEELKESLWETSIPYAIARQGQRSVDPNQTVVAFFDFPDSVISLSSDTKIIKTMKNGRSVEGRWDVSAMSLCQAGEKNCSVPWWAGRWGADEVLEKEIIQQYTSQELAWGSPLDTDSAIMGCATKTPLRFGDVDSDGKNELVLFVANGYSVDFLVFSLHLHKIIFASKLDFNDVIKQERLQADPSTASIIPDSVNQYQFWSRSSADLLVSSGMSKGYRGFAKLFIGNFSDQLSTDILVWRKAYKSLLLTDQSKGFEKISDMYVHYRLVNGEYKKQTTDQATIKSWLSAKQLTWQKGYPNKSECAGQEGQLIPEMHDPLLNDPDVLQ
jgi:hypothetical protein